MSDTVWERREAAAARLQGAPMVKDQQAPAAQDSAGDVLAGDIGSQIDQIDPTGWLRESVLAVALVAGDKPGFDVALTTGPDHDWAARILSASTGVQVSVQRVAGAGSTRMAPTAQSLTAGVIGTPSTAIFWGP